MCFKVSFICLSRDLTVEKYLLSVTLEKCVLWWNFICFSRDLTVEKCLLKACLVFVKKFIPDGKLVR